MRTWPRLGHDQSAADDARVGLSDEQPRGCVFCRDENGRWIFMTENRRLRSERHLPEQSLRTLDSVVAALQDE